MLQLKDSYLRLRAEESQWDPDTLPYFKFIPKWADICPNRSYPNHTFTTGISSQQRQVRKKFLWMELVFQVLRWRALLWSREPWRWRSTLACPPPCSAMPASSWPRTSMSSWKRWQPPLENHDNLLPRILLITNRSHVAALAPWRPHSYFSSHRQLHSCRGLGSLFEVRLILSKRRIVFCTQGTPSLFVSNIARRGI